MGTALGAEGGRGVRGEECSGGRERGADGEEEGEVMNKVQKEEMKRIIEEQVRLNESAMLLAHDVLESGDEDTAFALYDIAHGMVIGLNGLRQMLWASSEKE